MREFDALNLWQPVIWDDAPTVVDVTVTHAETFEVGDGGPKFIRAITDKLGLPTPERAMVKPFRSNLFTDEPSASNWVDAWPFGWSVCLSYASPPSIAPLVEPRSIEDTDETYVDDKHKYWLLDNVPCRVLADFKTEAAFATAKRNLHALGSLRAGSLPGLRRIEMIVGEFKLDGSPDAVLSTAVKALHVCREAGAITNLNER